MRVAMGRDGYTIETKVKNREKAYEETGYIRRKGAEGKGAWISWWEGHWFDLVDHVSF